MTPNTNETKAAIGNDLIVDEFTQNDHPTDNEEDLLEHNVPGRINIYAIKSFDGTSIGEAFAEDLWPNNPDLPPAAIVTEGRHFRTISHEIGHILLQSGNHNWPATNLMIQTEFSTHQDLLTPAQCDEMRKYHGVLGIFEDL